MVEKERSDMGVVPSLKKVNNVDLHTFVAIVKGCTQTVDKPSGPSVKNEKIIMLHPNDLLHVLDTSCIVLGNVQDINLIANLYKADNMELVTRELLAGGYKPQDGDGVPVDQDGFDETERGVVLIVEGEWVYYKMHCFIVNVYAPQSEVLRREYGRQCGETTGVEKVARSIEDI
ncbi:hypothetical protein L2E82_06208 [Cichorium intybus]|uniref:Uncharacterized protein n=1 Tax=Cichorium intybus TaxID=13427 RepID=A0ACB9H9V5_CICIN|nr:hypothetical protein L2E82_06208 [Cichorium intybus]